MRIKLTLFLAILNVITFGTIFYLQSERSPEKRSATSQPVLSSSIRGSDRIEITGDALPANRVLERKGNTWSLLEPVKWPANINAVERIFQSLLFLRKEIHFTLDEIRRNNQDLSDYGLDQPALILRMKQGERTTEIRIGSPTDVGNRYYLLGPSGEDIFVVDEDVVRAVALDIQDLQSSRLFHQNFFDIKEISVQPDSSRNLRIRLTATDEGWSFESPIQTRANGAAVDSRLQSLTETHVTTLTQEGRITPMVSGLATPRMRLSLEGGGKRQTFLLGNPKEGEEGIAYGQIEGTPTIITVPEEPFLAFSDAQTNLRERSFLTFSVPSLSSLRIIGSGDREVTLQKLEDESWRVISTDPENNQIRYAADREVLAETISSLLTLRASRFITDAPSESDLENYGLNQPQRRIRIESIETSELILGTIDPERMTLYAKMSNEPFVYSVPVQIIRELPLSPLAYRTRTLQRVPDSGKVRSIRIVRLPDEEVLLERNLRDDGISWEEEVAEIDGHEQIAFLELLQQVRNFRVASYLSNHFSEEGLAIEEGRILPWTYRWEAEIDLPGGNGVTREQRVYFITERIEGTLQGGGSATTSTSFTLPQSVIDAWHTLFFDRPLPPEYDESILEQFEEAPTEETINNTSESTED